MKRHIDYLLIEDGVSSPVHGFGDIHTHLRPLGVISKTLEIAFGDERIVELLVTYQDGTSIKLWAGPELFDT